MCQLLCFIISKILKQNSTPTQLNWTDKVNLVPFLELDNIVWRRQILFSICLPLPMKETTTLMVIISSVYCGKTFRSRDGLISSVGTTVSIQWLSYNASIETFFEGTLKISISIGQPFDDCRTVLHRDFYIIFNWCKCLVYINNK